MKTPLLVLASALLLTGLCAQTPFAPDGGGTPLTATQTVAFQNADVLKLTSAGMGDDIIIAKINEAPQTSFRLETDDLVALKKTGVSPSVISAMIKRGSGSRASANATSSGVALPSGFPGSEDAVITLFATDGTKKLNSVQGHTSTTYAFVTMLVFADFPGVRAEVRTHDQRPHLTIRSNKSPQGRYFLVRCKSNKKDGSRSVKQGRSGFFTHKEFGAPDADWTVPFDVKAVEPGVWQIDPKNSMESGEYGLYGGFMGIGMELYDFGIDG